MNFNKSVLLFGLVAMVITMLPFVRAFDYGLVNFDDYCYLTAHEEVTRWLGWASLRFSLTDVSEAIWMPLTWFSYGIDYLLFGEWFGGFHIHSILIHAVNAFLVWRILLLVMTAGGRPRSLRLELLCLISALIWSVHPLRCESVVALSSRKDVLSFFWEALAILCWIRGGTVRTSLAVVFFVLGAMCKPSVMTFPFLCLVIDAIVKREVRPLRYIIPMALSVGLSVFASWQQSAGGAMSDPFGQPLWGRLLGACAAFGIYIRNFICPLWLAPQCLKTWPDWPRFWLPGLIVSGLFGYWIGSRLLWYWDNRRQLMEVQMTPDRVPIKVTFKVGENPFLAGGLWLAIAIFPMLGIASFGYHAFADRFTYIPFVGLGIVLVAAMEWIAKRTGSVPMLIGGLAAVAALMACTWRQTGFWRDDERLFRQTLAVDGERNSYAHDALASWYFEFPHDLEKCVTEGRKALDTHVSGVTPSLVVHVIALCELGRTEEALEAIKTYETSVVKIFGRDRAYDIMSGRDKSTPKIVQIRMTRQFAKIALWLHTPGSTVGAREMLDELDSAFAEYPIVLYLRMKLAERENDTPLASSFKKELSECPARYGYLRFRYLNR